MSQNSFTCDAVHIVFVQRPNIYAFEVDVDSVCETSKIWGCVYAIWVVDVFKWRLGGLVV